MFVLASMLFPYGGMATTLAADKDSVIRREMINAAGQMVQASKSGSRASSAGEGGSEFCNFDFILGNEHTSSCNSSAHEILGSEEDDASECLEAASRSNAKAVHGKFEIGPEWGDSHPRGCFKDNCHEAANGVCYFFNMIGPKPDGSWPTTSAGGTGIMGFPVCKRPMLQNGTQDTHGGCPSDYSVIDDEETCREAANCWGFLQGTLFRVGEGAYPNASKNLDHPRGCFTDFEATHPTVYYNPKTLMGEGTNVKGTPICNVTKPVKWPVANGR